MLAIVATGIVMIIAYIFRNKIHNLCLGRDRDVTEEDLEQLTQPVISFRHICRGEHTIKKKYFNYNVDETIGFIWECTPLALPVIKHIYIRRFIQNWYPVRQYNTVHIICRFRTLRKK